MIPTVPVVAGFLPGGGELWVILLLALLFFGASRLPGIARSLGRSVNEFKQGMKDEPDGKSPATPPTEGNASKN